MISIIWIGFSLDPELEEHEELINKKVQRSLSERINKDESKIFNRYGLSCNGEPICLNEYSTKVANYKNVHVVQLDSRQDDFAIQEKHIDYDCNWNELVLLDR